MPRSKAKCDLCRQAYACETWAPSYTRRLVLCFTCHARVSDATTTRADGRLIVTDRDGRELVNFRDI